MIHLRARCHVLADTWTGVRYPIYDRSPGFCERWSRKDHEQKLKVGDTQLVVAWKRENPSEFSQAIVRAVVAQEMAS